MDLSTIRSKIEDGVYVHIAARIIDHTASRITLIFKRCQRRLLGLGAFSNYIVLPMVVIV